LRDWAEEQVSKRSPRPDSPISVSGFAPKDAPMRRSSTKPRVTMAAWALAPSPAPVTAPAAMAKTFFSAPPISTPIRSSLE
jgi:hypothetical protein